ncbi:MAG: GatB/YqeY domain-containing protein [Clostridiales bacterium]|nr:GatB/YqeY domain-containing protein [Clostridiales bacterium]
MDLKEQLMNDLKDAMKEKNVVKKNTVTMIRAAILQYEKDNLTQLDENGIIDIISKELKRRKDAMAEFEKSGRQDLIEELEKEIQIVKAYLPEELSVEELTQIIKDTIVEVDAKDIKDMGKVMKAVKEKTTGRADGRTINEIVKKELA